ncbi:hypothetical protein D0864_11827 [Hortaea werneckii]|uniref:F-box domain-containing protein n=1 Tax=Hortaea werneckii TaxID=91943 RepID=A0A3M7DQ11_HORWE|nr:hypothetical protein D0864_11827 [Hortaea werneckii]
MAPLIQKCRLFLLPQELQDEIFDLAFFNESRAGYMDIWEWRSRERERRTADHAHRVQPFPEPKVTQLLVSKRFFLAAARALIQSQSFGERRWPLAKRNGIAMDLLRTGIIPAFVRDLRCKLWDIRYVPDDLPNLKKLLLDVEDSDFSTLAPERMVCLDELDENDFAGLLTKKDWEKLLRLCKRVQVLEVKAWWYPTRAQEPAEEDMWKRNVSRFSRYIHEVQQMKEKQLDTSSTRSYAPGFMAPLYPGSKV